MSGWSGPFRRLGRSPGFAAAALLTLGLGIGANASIVSAIYALLLRPLPYPQPEKLVALNLAGREKGRLDLSLNTILDYRAQTKTLEALAGGIGRTFGLTAAGSSVSVALAAMVTSDFPAALGMEPALGRAFTEEEERQGVPVAVLTDALWRSRFGADPSVLGRRLELNEQPRTIVGVLPPGFSLPFGGAIPDLLIPISHADYGRERGAGHMQAIGRLRPGITIEDAGAELQAIAGRLAQSYPEDAGLGAEVRPLAEALRGRNRQPLLLLGGAGLLLLLIACANVTSLLLAQLMARSREVAIRISLGARVRDLARQFLADGVALGILGALTGLLMAGFFQSALPALLRYAGVESREPIPLGLPALLFALATLIPAAILFTVAPSLLAWRSHSIEPGKGSGLPGPARARLRNALVAGQVALGMTLLLSAGLLMRSFFRLMSVDPGFRVDQVFEFGIGIPEARYNTEGKMAAFHRRVVDKLREIPGVEEAGFLARAPLTGSVGTSFEFEPGLIDRKRSPRAPVNVVSPGYFRALSIPILRGRNFSGFDRPEAPRVALVNEAFVRAYSSRETPVGRRLRTGFENGELNPGGALSEIVGIVGDIRQFELETAPRPQVYLCAFQYGLEGGGYVIRTAASERRISGAARAAVAALDPRLEPVRVKPMSEFVRRNLGDRRIAAMLLGVLSLAGLALAGVGMYGVISFAAEQRMREMAVRLALGARPWQIARLIVGQGLRLAVLGLAIGLPGSVWTGSLLRARLYETSGADPAAFAGAAALLLTGAMLACAGPALRALRAPINRLLAGAPE